MDPLADLVDWIALYGLFGLVLLGLMERFVPAVPSHGVLVAVGIAAHDEVWSVPAAILGTAVGSFMGALAMFLSARSWGGKLSTGPLRGLGKRLGLSRQRIGRTLSSLRRKDRAISLTAQLIPTVRLISPVVAGFSKTGLVRFSFGLAIGIALWNGLFIAAGYLAFIAFPAINASAFAVKALVLLLIVEAVVALALKLRPSAVDPATRPEA